MDLENRSSDHLVMRSACCPPYRYIIKTAKHCSFHIGNGVEIGLDLNLGSSVFVRCRFWTSYRLTLLADTKVPARNAVMGRKNVDQTELEAMSDKIYILNRLA